MSDPDLPSYRASRKTTVPVEILTVGEILYLDPVAAERLERLLDKARKDTSFTEDIHKFSLCFEAALGNVFSMPGAYWTKEFSRRIGPILKACDIQLQTGSSASPTQWQRDVDFPRQQEMDRIRKTGKRG